MLRALAYTFVLATPAYAASIPDMQLHMNGGGQSPDVWVGDTARIVFLPATSDGGRWNAPQDSRFEVMIRCTDASIAYTVEASGGTYTLIPQPPQWERPVEPRCTETERDTLDILGKRLGELDVDILDFGPGYRFIRTAPSPELANLRNDLMLDDGRVWTPAKPPKFTRGSAVTLSYGVDTVGGFDGCNGWAADYTLVDGWSGPREFRRAHRSTLVYCGDIYGEPDTPLDSKPPLVGEQWVEVEDGELRTYPAFMGSHYLAVNAEELQRDYITRARAAQREKILEGLRLAPGESWVYKSSDLEHFSNEAGPMRTTTFTTLGSVSVTGTDGCNRFQGGRAILSEREIGWGLDLQGEMIATEMYCPNVLPILDHVFAPDTTINVHDGTLIFARASTMVTFHKTAAVN